MELTRENYFTGPDGVRRDKKYAAELTVEINENVDEFLPKLNELLEAMASDGIDIIDDPMTGSPVHSGWRPPAVNEKTSNAAAGSNHLAGLAADLYDPKRELAAWAVQNLDILERIGLWIEDPRWTPTWLHVQPVPPRSWRRCYVPSTAPAKCAALPGQVTA